MIPQFVLGEMNGGIYMNKIADMPVNERPYEKCIEKGPTFLSDEELLAVILRTGNRELNSMELARTIITKENKTDILKE